MNRKIIFNGREGRFDVPFFTLSENENLQIEIGLPQPQNGAYYFAARHGKALKRVALTGHLVVELTVDWLKQGGAEPIVCEIELRDRSGMVVYKKYNVEPLEIKEAEVGTEYFAAVQAVERENEALRMELSETKAELAEVKKIVKNIPAAIEQAKKEAVIEAAGGDPMGA